MRRLAIKKRKRILLIFLVILALNLSACSVEDNSTNDETSTSTLEANGVETIIQEETEELEYFTVDELVAGVYFKEDEKFYRINEMLRDGSHSRINSDEGCFDYMNKKIQLYKVKNPEESINTVSSSSEIVEVTSSGNPPNKIILVPVEIPNYWIIYNRVVHYDYNNTFKVYKLFEDQSNTFLSEVNGISDFSQLNIVEIEDEFGVSEYFLAGEKDEAFAMSRNAGTQGLNTATVYADSKLIICPPELAYNPYVLTFSEPHDGYVSAPLNELPKGYYVISGEDILIEIK